METSIAESQRLKNIKVPSELADLLRVYCIFKGKKVTDFTSSLLSKELEPFKQQIEMARFKSPAEE